MSSAVWRAARERMRALAEARPAPDRWATLTYHELEVPGRRLATEGRGYAVYCVARDVFRAQMDALSESGMRGSSVGEARARADARTVAISFDDGCETDLLEAAPILREHGFRATFFVVAGYLGTPGHLSPAQLAELASAGFEIGSHSLTHRALTGLPPEELHAELAGSRARLEDAAGATINHFSCPHGRWSPALAAAARRAGYATVSTSEVGLNLGSTPDDRLRRVAVRRGVNAAHVAGLARGHSLRRQIARDAALDAGKRLLGDGRYARLRERLLG